MLNKLLLIFILALPVFSQTFRPVSGNRNMVVSEHHLASATGLEILKQGGNAVDAAVATSFTLAVVFPQAGNLGGGGFMLIHLASGENLAIDFRETAPLSAIPDMYLDSTGQIIPMKSLLGHQASGVPGSVAGLWLAHQKYGRLPWKKLLAPAIRLAEQGFVLDAYDAEVLAGDSSNFARHAATAEIFLNKGKCYRASARFKQTDLAATLKRIAVSGATGFYHGPTAALIIAEMDKSGGLITEKDLSAYQAKIRKPVQFNYRGKTIISMPPPSSGGIMINEIFNTLSLFDLSAIRPGSSEQVQLWTEILRKVYEERAFYLGDPDFVTIPAEYLTSMSHAEEIKHQLSLLGPGISEQKLFSRPVESGETTHLSVLDEQGNAVSLTTTLNGKHGAKYVISGAGFLMNNEMDDFSSKPGTMNMFGLIGNEQNAIEPGKRMLSSMTPTIVLSGGTVCLVLGSPGGSQIITSVAQVLSNVLDYEMNIRDAIEFPRFHHQWLPDVIYLEEKRSSVELEKNLKLKGYKILNSKGIGSVQGIAVSPADGRLEGWSDPRRNGSAQGN